MAERKIIKGRVEKTDPKYPNNWKMTYLSSKGGYRPVKGHTGRFSPGVHEAREKVIDVIFEWESSKADRIRLPDEDASVFDAPVRAPKQMDADEADALLMRCLPARYKRRETKMKRKFVNPYNFVPAPPPKTDGPLGQHAPAGHHRYHEERWNGRIEVEIETITPLLLPDAAKERKEKNDHKTFPIRRGPDDRPYLAPTALKGMLRSAYEAITNSRLGVFRGHEDRLARRMEATEGLAMIPARISEDGQNVELLMGFTSGKPSKTNNRWKVPGPMYAAWLPRYRKGQGGVAPWAVRYPNGDLPQHGDEVFCWLQEFGKQNRNGQTIFTYWRVIHIARNADELPPKPRLQKGRDAHQPTGSPPRKVRGIVCITNQNIGNKHDERVFILEDLSSAAAVHTETIPLTPELKQAWKELVRNYQKEHEGDLEKRRKKKEPCDKFFGKDPGQTAFSRHVCVSGTEELKGGDLVYARVDEQGNVVGLYPVMISRELQGASPESLLPRRLRPATALDELSPADRVFGWVKPKGHGAWRGSLRIGAVRCEADDAIEKLEDEVDGNGLPLAILSTPKPQQARFYVARDACGGAQNDGLPKDEAAYAPGKGLRGRKVYPQHAQVSGNTDYWNAEEAFADARQHEAAALEANGRQVYREYVRHPKKPDDPSSNRGDQNRSMTEWVRPGVVFSARLEVENLDEAELGALLWLLDLPDGHCLRLGYGKPLGFGSVRVRLRAVDLVSGAGRKEQFRSLLPVKLAEGQRMDDIDKARERFVKAFQAAIEKAYGTGQGSFAQVPFITAFLKAAKGIEGMPVHYPRTQPQPDPKGENFRWFGDNENTKGGLRLALPDLVASVSVGLPYGAKADDDLGDGHGRGRNHRGRPRGGRGRR